MKIQLFSLLAFALLALAACEPASDDDAGGAPDYAAFDSSVEAINALITAHSAEDITACGNLLSDTLIWSPPWYNGNEWLGKADYLEGLASYHRDYDNITWEEGIVTPDTTFHGMWSGSVFPEETATNVPTLIRVYGTWTGTHVASGVNVGVKWFALAGVDEGGQISSLSEYFDVNGLATQIAAATEGEEDAEDPGEGE